MSNFKGAKCFGIEFRDCNLKGLISYKPLSQIKLAVECISAQHLSQVVIYPTQILSDNVSKNMTYLKIAGWVQTYMALP